MRDPLFAARMAYIGPLGIPLSTFLSWPEHDQDAALLWQAHESKRCHNCGTHPYDWNPDKGGRRHAYLAQVVRCPGCSVVDSAQKTNEKELAAPGMMVRLIPAPDKEIG